MLTKANAATVLGSLATCAVLAAPVGASQNYSVSFDGLSGRATTGGGPPIENSTWEAWIRVPDWMAHGGGTGSAWVAYGWGSYNGGMDVFAQVGQYTSPSNVSFLSPAGYCDPDDDGLAENVPTAQWMHVAYVFGSDQNYNVYVNGVWEDQSQHSCIQSYGYGSLIVADNEFGDSGGNYAGLIDELRISTVPRYTSNFVPETYFVADAGTWGLWHMDEGQGSIAQDASGNGRDLSISGGYQWVEGDLPSWPHITSIAGTFAQDGGQVTISGTSLDSVTGAQVEGVAVPIVGQSSTSLSLAIGPMEPGFADLELVHPGGALLVGNGVELWPTATATDTGVGGSVSVELDNGSAGLYVLAYATGLLPSPIAISGPPTWSGLWLDVTGPFFVIGTNAFPTPAAAQLSYAVPNDPFLTGLVVHIQAWCQQGFFGLGVSYSFTNVATVTI